LCAARDPASAIFLYADNSKIYGTVCLILLLKLAL